MIWARLVGWWRFHSPRQLRTLLDVAVAGEAAAFGEVDALLAQVGAWLDEALRDQPFSEPDFDKLAAIIGRAS